MGVRKHQKRHQGRSVLDGNLAIRKAPEHAADGAQHRDLVCRTMNVRSASINEGERSIEAIMATEQPTAVFDMQSFRVIDEVLLARGAEFPTQVQLLDTHMRWTIGDVLGSTRQIRREGGEIVGRLFFADDARSEDVWKKVKAGHVTDVSVGYRAIEYVDIAPGKTQVVAGKRYTAGDRTLRITIRWQIRELSVVPIGADSAAKFRSDDPPHLELTMNPQLRAYLESLGMRTDLDDAAAWKYFDNLGGKARAAAVALHNVDPQGRAEIAAEASPEPSAQRTTPAIPGTPAGTPEPAGGSTPPTEDQLRQQARDEERARVRMINERAANDVPHELVERAINEGWNEARVGQEFLTAVRSRGTAPVGGNSPTPIGERAPAGHSRSRERDLNVRAVAAQVAELAGLNPVGLVMRGMQGENGAPITISEQDADRGRNYLIRNSFDYMREVLRIEGIREPRDEHEVCRAAFSTLSLQAVFTTSVHAKLVEGYENSPDTTDWAQVEEVANFQIHDDITVGKVGSPKLLERGGKAQHATLSSKTEQFRALRYALQMLIPEEDIIDDRLGAIMQTVPTELAETFAELRPDLVYSAILENPTLNKTGFAVFGGTGHANTSSTALSEDAINVGQVAMANQRVDGRYVNNAPRFLLVPPNLDAAAHRLLNSSTTLIKGNTDASQGDLNTVRRLGLQPRAEPRLGAAGVLDPRTGVQRTGSATNWWLASNRRTLKVVYRRGTGRRPTMRTYVLSQGQWGIGWDINLDIGVGFSDYIGWFRGNT